MSKLAGIVVVSYLTVNSAVFILVRKSASVVDISFFRASLKTKLSFEIVLPAIAFPSLSISVTPAGSPVTTKLSI